MLLLFVCPLLFTLFLNNGIKTAQNMLQNFKMSQMQKIDYDELSSHLNNNEIS